VDLGPHLARVDLVVEELHFEFHLRNQSTGPSDVSLYIMRAWFGIHLLVLKKIDNPKI
jgi:hypothetical protein